MLGRSNYKKVDDTISAVEGGWEFNEEVAESFDTHVRKSIPLYDELQDMTVDLSEWFINSGSTVYDIGSSTGETISRLLKKHIYKKNVKYIGIDASETMIKLANIKVAAGNVKFMHQDVLQTKFEAADFIASLFTLQFLGMREKLKVLQSIYDGLNNGGALVIAEKIIAEESRYNDLWIELYWDFKRKQGLTDDQVLQKARSLRGVLRPLTISEHTSLLHMSGFGSVDIFFKWYNFAGLIAIKTTASEKPLKSDGSTEESKNILETSVAKRTCP